MITASLCVGTNLPLPRRLSWMTALDRLRIVFAIPALLLSAQVHAKTITAVMHSDLRVIDPGLTTAYITRDHGYMVFDTLLAMDSKFKIQPQMANWQVSDDGLTYIFRLRDGLRWHDGAPVTADDCVASLRRWGRADGMGQKLMEFTASLEATDAKTITLILREPYGLVLESIGKPSSLVPFMMPKRLAETPTGRAIPEQIGSGPFKFVQAEFQPGVKAVYEKNRDYVPRAETPSWTAGGKVVKVDRVEWVTAADTQSAMTALQSGAIDFLENLPFDQLPTIERNKSLVVRALSPLGFQTLGRMNFLHPPFDNSKVRRAAFLAMSQKPVLEALVGNSKYYEICGAIFGCDTPLASEIGSETLTRGNGMAEARKLLAESGYDGTPVVLLAPTDVSTLKAQPVVAAQLLREAGFTVDLQSVTWQTVVNRRASQTPPQRGGWNMFFTNWAGPDILNPIANVSVGARGKAGGWFGWPDDARIEQLRDRFARSNLPVEQKRIAIDIQSRAYELAIYVPLGQYRSPSAWRSELNGVLDGLATPVFWNIDKTDRGSTVAAPAVTPVVAAAPATLSAAGRRVALVLGNAAYKFMPSLTNPRNDAADVEKVLKDLGFETVVATDLDRIGMNAAIARFSRLVTGAEVAMVYYSGHGMQFAGKNYLLPTDANLETSADVNRFQLMPVDDLVEMLGSAKGLQLIVLDACRNNPVERDFKNRLASAPGGNREASLSRGFSRIDARSGLVVTYATAANDVAADGGGRNSPFTMAFLKNVVTPDLEVRQMLYRVQSEVYAATEQRQLPEISSLYVGPDIRFKSSASRQ